MKDANMPLLFSNDYIRFGHHQYDRHLVEEIIRLASNPEIENIVIDGFCGMGGVTEGFNRLSNYMVIVCLNHWDTAIETHKKNHPMCLHLLEDFKTADLRIIDYMVREIKKYNPNIKTHGWFSLECTNFSGAKGGMPRDADSRTLADHLDRYVSLLNFDVIWIENVREFTLWGPMIPKVVAGKGKKNRKTLQFNPEKDDAMTFFSSYIEAGIPVYCPLARTNKNTAPSKWLIPEKATLGKDFRRWVKEIESFGYKESHGLFNVADYGVPQHRRRLIMQFNRVGEKAVWPKPTHDKYGRNGLPVWNPVKPCLDLQDEGHSVLSFVKKKGKLVPRITSPKTIDRLINGIETHGSAGTDGENVFITKFLSNNPNTLSNKGASVNEVSPAITTQPRLYFTKTTSLLDHYFGNGYCRPISSPAGTTGTKDGAALHTIHFLGTYHSCGNGSKLCKPCAALTTKDKYPLFTAQFITQRTTGLPSAKNTSLCNPSRVITSTGGNLELVSTWFMTHNYTSGQTSKSVNEPSGALLQNPKQRLTEVQFLMDTNYERNSFSMEFPCRTITAGRKYFYIVNFQWFNSGFRSIDIPSNTLIARQDKSPNYLVTLETGELAIEIFENDPPHYIRLKQYMASKGIVSVNMRMLKDVEMLRIMTIDENSKLSPSSTKNKKMIGNAVPSDFVEMLGAAYSPVKTIAKVA